jgi:hypothetical protein
MKLKLIFALGLVLLLCGCRAHYPVEQQSGKDDIAYLLFVSQKDYANKHVTVSLDGENTFEAKVVKAKDSYRKGTSYAIATGRRKINVEYKGNSIYNKEIFVSTQETKIITLP